MKTYWGPRLALLVLALSAACANTPSDATGLVGGVAGHEAGAGGRSLATGGGGEGGGPGEAVGGTGATNPEPMIDAGAAGAGGTPVMPEEPVRGFFGEPRCAQAGVVLCDSFEGGAIDTVVWQLGKLGSNVVELTSETAARGNKSVHIRAQNNFGYLRTRKPFPMPNNTYWARMFLRVKRYSTVAWAHWTVAEASGKGDGSLIRVGGQFNSSQGKNRWGVGSDRGPTGDWTMHDRDPNNNPLEPPLSVWTCLEWLHDGQNDVTRFFVDGVEHPSLATTAAKHGGTSVPYVMPEFDAIWFGWWQYQQDPQPFDIWIDEIAIDDERVGCQR